MRELESNATNRRGVERSGRRLFRAAYKSEMTGRLFVVSGVDSISSSIVDWSERERETPRMLIDVQILQNV